MISSGTDDRELELWPALGALFVAGLLSTLVSGVLLNQLRVDLETAHQTRLFLVFQLLVTAALTAFALPYALRAVAGFDLTTGAAFAVALGGSVVSLAFALLLTRAFAATTGVVDGGAGSILPLLAALAAEYQLLKRLARPVRVAKPPLAVEAELAYASASPALPPDVDAAAARVRYVVSSLAEAAPVDVPARVQEGLDDLQQVAAALEAQGALDPARRLFVAGIRQLQGELVELAESAWRGDHRAAINRLQGPRTIENALEKLGE